MQPANESAEGGDERTESELEDRLVLLVGARRSGTNWVERILTAHPEIVAMPTETYLFSHGAQAFRDLIQHTSPGSRTVAKTYMPREAFQRALRHFLDSVLLSGLERSKPEARYLLERTPWHGKHLGLIAEVYPDARVLHLIRDGRAVSRSLQTLPGGPRTIADAAIEWRDSVVLGRRGAQLFGDRYREIRYEELLADTDTGCRALFEWLGLTVTPTLMRGVLNEAAAEFNVDPGSPGIRHDKWRDELSKADLATIRRVAGGQLAELGYEDEGGRAVRAGRIRPSLPPTAIESVRRVLQDPVGPVKRRLKPRAARAAREELLRNRGVVERFNELAAEGREEQASSLCMPNGQYKLVDDGRVFEGRGRRYLDEILRALREHQRAGQEPISSVLHVSRSLFTINSTYRLAGGEQWVQSAVYEVGGGVITSLSLYRFGRGRP